MAEKYGWCKESSIAHVAKDGKEYCAFHAPQGKKGLSFEEFNKLIFLKILEAKANREQCNLSGTIFEGDINFSAFNEDNLLSEINFSNAIFSGETYFRIARFSEDAIFHGATFSKKIDFQGAKFDGKAFFQKALFNDQTYFIQTIFNNVAGFSTATFNGEAYFHGATFNEKVDCFETIFNNDIYFCNTNIKEMVKFEKANLVKVFFMDTDLKKIDFINCMWAKKIGRNVLHDEIELFKKKGENKDFKEKIKKVEILYRLLKQKYKEEHNEPEVSNWHYGEKEMFRKSNRWRRFLPSVSTLYWLSSGYGERPVRSGLVLFLLIIALSIFFGLTGIKAGDNSSIIKIKEWADILNLDYLKATIEYATFESKPIFIPEHWFFKIAAKLLIPLQAALFALALRNRFRR